MLTPFKNEPFTDFTLPDNRSRMEETLSRVEAELGRTYPLIIGGERVSTAQTFVSINPSDKDQVVATFSKAGVDEANRAIEVAYQRFTYWSRVPPDERANILLRAANIMRKRRFELTAWMVFEVGKNWLEADADVAEAIDYCEFYAREMLRYAEGQPLTELPGEHNTYVYLPLGVVAVIPPWNFPLAILVGMTTAALVTGNTVVLKPASDSPTIGYKFVEIMEEAGLPPGILNYIPGSGGEIGDFIVSHPKTRMIAFTGSKAVGLRINELAAKPQKGQKWIKRVIAEMGGKDAIIMDDEFPDWDYAIDQIIVSAYGYQGQKCSAASRLIVVDSIYDKFIDALVDKVKTIDIGPAKENHFMGPVINERAERSILEYIEIGKTEGKLLTGGKKAPGNGYYIEPTVFSDVDPYARIAQEEIFGPVLSVIRAKDYDHAIEIANSTEYGLTGAVFTLNPDKIHKAKQEFFVGNLYINRKCTGALVGSQPFGGFNMSGTDSKAGGRDYLLLFLQAKTISHRY